MDILILNENNSSYNTEIITHTPRGAEQSASRACLSGREGCPFFTRGDTREEIEGESIILIATVTPEDADDTSVTWSSSDEDVAIVSSKGKVVAMGLGTAIITATATNGTATLTTGLEAGSIAIVKIGNYSIKVAIK